MNNKEIIILVLVIAAGIISGSVCGKLLLDNLI